MTVDSSTAEILAALRTKGLDEIEVYRKRGRSRRFEIGLAGKSGSSRVERGWAIRAGTPRASLSVAGSGDPSADIVWPDPDGQPLRLPTAVAVPAWRAPDDLDAALVGESEAMALLADIDAALTSEVADCRLVRAVLEEGTSETAIASTLGVEASYRSRAASLLVEATCPGSGPSSAVLSMAERDPRAFRPTAIASRMANQLMLSRPGEAPAKDRGDVLMAPPVAAMMLASLQPLVVGPQARDLAHRFRDRRGRLGSKLLTVVDDGRLPGGVLEAPVDGEGLPTGPIPLIEEGEFRQALVDWRTESGESRPIPGRCRRASWRDLPALAPSHLYLEPRSGIAVGDLLQSIARGYYLVEALGPGRFDFAGDRFRLPVCGFVLRQGKAAAPLSPVWLEGAVSALLRNIQAVARDLRFHPLGALVGAPTVLVSGLGLSRLE